MKSIRLLALCGLFCAPLLSAVAQSDYSVGLVFLSGSDRLANDSQPELIEEIADRMKSDPRSRAHITGYGKPGETHYIYGGRISPMGEARAERVRRYLVTLFGIDPARIVIASATSRDEPMAIIALSEK